MKEQLLKLLRERKQSIRQISELSGVSTTTINHWIFDGIEPTLGNAEKVLNALGYKFEIKRGEANDNE